MAQLLPLLGIDTILFVRCGTYPRGQPSPCARRRLAFSSAVSSHGSSSMTSERSALRTARALPSDAFSHLEPRHATYALRTQSHHPLLQAAAAAPPADSASRARAVSVPTGSLCPHCLGSQIRYAPISCITRTCNAGISEPVGTWTRVTHVVLSTCDSTSRKRVLFVLVATLHMSACTSSVKPRSDMDPCCPRTQAHVRSPHTGQVRATHRSLCNIEVCDVPIWPMEAP
jgi:hypothetical protein